MWWNKRAKTCCICVVGQMMRRVRRELGGAEKDKKRDGKFGLHGRNELGPKQVDKVVGS
jgi:hypothetical protein